MRLEKSERETIVTFDDSSSKVEVYTASPKIMRELERKGYKVIAETDISKTYIGDIRHLTFRTYVKNSECHE